MSDITDHKWSDCNISDDCMADRFSIKLKTDQISPVLFSINISDTIAIANHFKDHIYFNVDTQQFEEIPHTG